MKSIKTYIPNTITCLNLLCGCLAIVLAFSDKQMLGPLETQQWAWVLIAAASVFDFCDGLSARALGAYSPMGKELDSLSDLVSFGLAPAFLVMNAYQEASSSMWLSLVALMIGLCGALRLATFNVDTRQTTSFIGLPIPANAIFWIGVLGWIRVHGWPGDVVMTVIVVIFSLLMVSELKMFSLKVKSLDFKSNVRRYTVLLAGVLFVITEGVAGLAWTIVLYILISLLGKKTEAN